MVCPYPGILGSTFLENLCEMIGLLLPDVIDAKDVDTESDQERLPVMFPKIQCDVALLVAVLVEAIFEEILCKDVHLQETVHDLLFFEIDCTLVGSQVVEVHGG
jgi:hypothetical protein